MADFANRRGEHSVTVATVNAEGALPMGRRALLQRIRSALILMPAALVGAWLGGAVFAALVAFLSIVMVFEWTRMTERREFSPTFTALSATAMAAMTLASAGLFLVAAAVTGLGGAAAAFAARRSGGRAIWGAVGAAYVVAPCVALVWMRQDFEAGRALVLLLFAIVWATDTGAYLVGKGLGGPRVTPEISPTKTWTGMIGGALAGAISSTAAGAVFFGAYDFNRLVLFFVVGASLAIITELGDVVESAVKRRFGVKDASGFIPGHGGALDRLDGMIFATIVMATVLAALFAIDARSGL